MGGNQQRNGKLKDIMNIKSPVGGSVAELRRSKLDDTTVDVGALMRKALQAPKLKNPGETANAGPSAAQKEAEAKQVELRGNPIYSPDDSLAKAASKLAHLKTTGSVINPSTDSAASAREPASPPQEQALRKPRPSEGATPGWRPEAEGMHASKQSVPLAAGSVISKRNRRKSVYQRPARYGDWFDGDEDELDKMVDGCEEEDDGENGGRARAAAAAQAAQRTREMKDKANRRKSAFPAVGRQQQQQAAPEASPLGATVAAPQGATPVGSDIVNKVRAIADGLCERLDGLIEESPAVGVVQRDEKSLRDKLLESWEGRSYYDRLMQMAAENGEKDPSQSFKEAVKHTGAPEPAKPIRRENLLEKAKIYPTSPAPMQPVAEETDEAAGKEAAALHFLSPPKPKLRVDVNHLPANNAAAAAGPKALSTTAARKPAMKEVVEVHPIDTARLLRVSARGPKPMAAPWEQQEETPVGNTITNKNSTPSAVVGETLQPPSGSKREQQVPVPAAVQINTPVTAPSAATSPAAVINGELESMKAALKEALAAKEVAEAAAEAARAETVELRAKLEEAEEEAKAQAEANTAAEKRIAILEEELQALQEHNASADGPAAKAIKKIGERAADVEGRFGLAEVQIEALLSAVNTITEHLAEGRAEAQEVVELAQAAVPAAVDGGRRKTRGRRKSTWR